MKNYFAEMRRIYGSHGRAAAALGVPLRTYMDWKNRGFKGETTLEKLVHAYLRSHLDNTSTAPPRSTGHHKGENHSPAESGQR